MNIFALTRKLPDGRSAMGPLFYILIALGILGLFLYYNIRMSGNPEAVKERPKNRQDVNQISEAANAFQGVREKKDPARGSLPVGDATPQPDVQGSPQSFLDTFNYVNNLDAKASRDKKSQTDGTLGLATPSPRVQTSPVVTATPAPPERFTPTIFYNLTPTPSPTPLPSITPAPSGFETNNFLPRGALIPVYFLSMVKTGSLEDLVILGVAENVILNHQVQLPFGTRLLGSAAADGDGDRVAVNIDTVLFPNGEELPISGIAKDIDRGPGVRAYYIPQPMWVTLLPYVNNFIAAYLNTLQKTITATTTAVTPNGTTVSQSQQVADLTNPQTALVNSASQALQNATQVTMQQINQLYKPYLVIPPGTPAFIQLRQATDITRKRINGSENNPMGILPGFRNNPIPPAGLNEPGDEPNNNASNVLPLTGQNTGVQFIPNIPVSPQGNSRNSNSGAVPDLTSNRIRANITDANQSGLVNTLTPVQPPVQNSPTQTLLPLQ